MFEGYLISRKWNNMVKFENYILVKKQRSIQANKFAVASWFSST
jgi:hypothetical protein